MHYVTCQTPDAAAGERQFVGSDREPGIQRRKDGPEVYIPPSVTGEGRGWIIGEAFDDRPCGTKRALLALVWTASNVRELPAFRTFRR